MVIKQRTRHGKEPVKYTDDELDTLKCIELYAWYIGVVIAVLGLILAGIICFRLGIVFAKIAVFIAIPLAIYVVVVILWRTRLAIWLVLRHLHIVKRPIEYCLLGRSFKEMSHVIMQEVPFYGVLFWLCVPILSAIIVGFDVSGIMHEPNIVDAGLIIAMSINRIVLNIVYAVILAWDDDYAGSTHITVKVE